MEAPAERTLALAVGEVRYAVIYGELNERFWRRLDTLINFVGVVAGSAAFASLLGSTAWLTALAGAVVAMLSGMTLVLRPLERAIEFRDFRRRFQDLDIRAWTMSLHDVDAELKRLVADAPIGFTTLHGPARNQYLTMLGRVDQVQPLSWWERAALMLA